MIVLTRFIILINCISNIYIDIWKLKFIPNNLNVFVCNNLGEGEIKDE